MGRTFSSVFFAGFPLKLRVVCAFRRCLRITKSCFPVYKRVQPYCRLTASSHIRTSIALLWRDLYLVYESEGYCRQRFQYGRFQGCGFFFNVQNLTRVLFCSRLPTTTYLCICGALLFAMPTVIAVYAA